MPAFGCNQYALPFIMGIFDKEVLVSGGGVDEDGNPIPPVYESIGFRLSDRIVTAVDRFVGSVIGRLSAAGPTSYNPNGYGWGRWLFMHLFVGGMDWTHAIDIVGNYDLTFSGTVTHHANGITFGSGGIANTGCDMANASANGKAWNRRAQGFYCRTNNVADERNLNAFVSDANGHNYWQGIYPRYTDGRAISDFHSYQNRSTLAIGYNRAEIATSPGSHGFWVQLRTHASDHRLFRNGVTLASDAASEVGMGTGTGPVSMLTLSSASRNFCFLFSTKHLNSLNAAEVGWFNDFVQALQIALQRNV